MQGRPRFSADHSPVVRTGAQLSRAADCGLGQGDQLLSSCSLWETNSQRLQDVWGKQRRPKPFLFHPYYAIQTMNTSVCSCHSPCLLPFGFKCSAEGHINMQGKQILVEYWLVIFPMLGRTPRPTGEQACFGAMGRIQCPNTQGSPVGHGSAFKVCSQGLLSRMMPGEETHNRKKIAVCSKSRTVSDKVASWSPLI